MSKSDHRATLAKRRADVSAMFDGVADRYDLMNTVMTGGIVESWRREVVAALDPRPGELILDLAAGTGTSSRTFADRGATVVPTDLSLGMLQVGRKRQPDLHFVHADALCLPYADATFDAVTISFGLRNVEHTLAALQEMHRVTRPGGRLVIAEFSTPTNPVLRFGYQDVVLKALPVLGRVLSSNPSAYDYLIESIRAWPTQTALADLLVDAGWQEVAFRNLTGGIVALHRGKA
ncbi:demethylmenaquinone methyltransferase [Granulicoccus phenolivorans]|uniref:demethylmenaquinone methyltransferase n=1 Tax=Granulicoccus phenolivorans TaxID=266854 RepID=UPI0004152036|nr:demethylmenaquinone methyltransferase [Granulicoccus phenolivorans]